MTEKMEKTIDKIAKGFNEAPGVKLLEMQLNFGNENRIMIEIEDPADFPKWEYFCKRLAEGCDSVHTVKRYPKLLFIMPLDKNALAVGLEGLIYALSRKYYLISEPPEKDMTIIAKVTNLCNLDCKYCYDKPFRDRLGHNGIIPLEKLEKAIKMASEYARTVTILWHGGEPSLAGLDFYRKIYDEILPKFPYADFDIDMQSNGTLIDDKWCDFCIEKGLAVGSSYNATQEDLRQRLDENRTGKRGQTVDRAFENIKHAIKRGVTSGVIDVMTKENHGRIREIYEFYKDAGVSACFNEINDAGEAEKHDFLFITEEDQKQYLETTTEYFTYWATDQDRRCYLDRYASEYMQLLLTGQSYVCHNGNHCLRHWVGINSNGDIYPCDRALPDKYRLGNIEDFTSFREVYETEKYRNFASERNCKLKMRCSKCDVFGYCHGNCPMIDIDASGSAAEANEYACTMQHLNILCAYRALAAIRYEDCNFYLKHFLVRNCVFLPGEIPALLEKLGVKERFAELDFSDTEASLDSEQFRLFAAVNAPCENDWITRDFSEFYSESYDIDCPLEDDRMKRAVEAIKERADQLIPQLKSHM